MRILDGIRKLAAMQYANQPWGGSIADAEPASPGGLGDLAGSAAAGFGLDRLTSPLTKAMPSLRMPVGTAAFTLGDMAYKGTVGANRRTRSAADYGRRLGYSNPHLAYSV